jgi:hypothetical protein
MEEPILFQRFMAHIDADAEINVAWHSAVVESCDWATEAIARGAPPELVLHSLGLEDPERLAHDIRMAEGREKIAGAAQLRVVFSGDSVKGIPSANCIQAYLPRDRKPTREEIQKAWHTCAKKT